jgi:phage recombination protein Bet
MVNLSTTTGTPSATLASGSGWDENQVEILRSQIMPGATDDELRYFLNLAKITGLDPFRKQVFAVKRYDTNKRKEVWAYQTSIDGFRSLAEQTGFYAGSDAPTFDEGISLFECTAKGRRYPSVANITVWKIVNGVRYPFTGIAAWSEYVQKAKTGEPTRFWASMPFTMLAKCAEAQALRKAFPQSLGGLYTREEMAQADNEQIAVEPEMTQEQRAEINQLRTQLKKTGEEIREIGYQFGINGNATQSQAGRLIAKLQDMAQEDSTIIDADAIS